MLIYNNRFVLFVESIVACEETSIHIFLVNECFEFILLSNSSINLSECAFISFILLESGWVWAISISNMASIVINNSSVLQAKKRWLFAWFLVSKWGYW
jgi:hypothetical protein